jgi:hypothetical protein
LLAMMHLLAGVTFLALCQEMKQPSCQLVETGFPSVSRPFRPDPEA